MVVAAEIMTRDVITVRPEMPVGEVAELLRAHRFGGVPVTDDAGTVLGVVTEEDLVERASRVHLPRYVIFLGAVVFLENPQKFNEEAAKILAVSAGEIMNRALDTVPADAPVEEVATRLLDDDLRRLLVLDDAGHLRGIITRADIVRLFTK